MRIASALFGIGTLLVAIAAAPRGARAQAFPAGGAWTPLTRAGSAITAPVGATPVAHLDVVGDAANAPAFVHSDASYLYLRVRVNGDPRDGGELRSATWGCAIDSDATLGTYEYLAALDATAATDEVVFRRNATTALANSPAEVAEVIVDASTDVAQRSAVSTAGTSFGGGPDFFVDLAVPWSAIRGGAAPIPAGRSLRFVCGASAASGQIGADTFAPFGDLSAAWSDGFVCDDAGCARDRDQDGVPDDVEASLGTMPTKSDSDGDGIPDGVELSASGGAPPFTAIDTDADGTIDALDADSDNDCVGDKTEGALGFRNPALPNNTPSAACTPATPVCDRTKGACVVCDADFGGGTDASCAYGALPWCQSTPALAGRCTQCKPTETALCGGATPACESATGTCSACNGDHGTNATAVCPDAAAPVCQTAGALGGRCTECTVANPALCGGAKPACDAGTGTCEPCNGDRGGGATRACPSTGAPRCDLGAGTCGTCTTDADCGAGHTGPTCDVPTGQCVDVDTDGDGLNDTVEGLLGTDPTKKDTDGDGIQDDVEVTPAGGGATTKVDTDGDGTIDALDTDSDDDGVLDAVEGAGDTDGDGAPDFRDTDDDGDGIATADELADQAKAKVGDDVDGDGKKNWADDDADGDGKGDAVEGRGDEDGDGIPDYLDAVLDVPTTDGGSGSSSGSTSSGGGSSSASSSGGSGQSSGGLDGGAPVDEGVIEGTGLFCATGGGGSSRLALVVLLAIGVAAAGRRRARR